MALVFDGTNKRFAERLDDLEGEVFGPDGSAYRLRPRIDGFLVEASSQAEEDTAFAAGARIVVRLDLLAGTTTAAPATTTTTAAPTTTTTGGPTTTTTAGPTTTTTTAAPTTTTSTTTTTTTTTTAGPYAPFTDEFNDSSVSAAHWATSVANSGAVTEDTADIHANCTAGNTAAALIILNEAVTADTHSYMLDFDTAPVSSANKDAFFLMLTTGANPPAAGDASSTWASSFAFLDATVTDTHSCTKRAADTTQSSLLNDNTTITYAGVKRYVLDTTATQWRWRVLRADTQEELWASAWQDWSDTLDGGNYYLCFGRMSSADVATRVLDFKFARFQRT